MSNRSGGGEGQRARPPEDPFEPEQVRRWQERAQSPAAGAEPQASGGNRRRQTNQPPGATPVSALTLPQAPGPEGLAEQFAFKFVAGVFDVDISDRLRPAGIATHLAYGSSWGVIYGLLQGSYHWPSGQLGVLYGLLVWLVGPALLVPAMRLLRLPWQEPPLRASMLLAGHLAYGAALAAAFDQLERQMGNPG
jgi:uncharacterized membrane protein YagU involved in acid resistance